MKFNIKQFLDLTNYEQSRNGRRKGAGGTAEFFTPYSIVKRMCDKVSDEDWADPKKTFLEPSCGNGQFVIYMIYNRLQHGIDWKTALKTCFALDLMQDNVDEMKERVHTMLSQICQDYVGVDPKTGCVHTPYNKASASRIMNNNFVCSDFFKWNFEEWRPMTEEEIKKANKKK